MFDQNTRRLRHAAIIAALGALCACETATGSAVALDKGSPAKTGIDARTGAGLYFPAPTSFEEPQIRFPTLEGVGPAQRRLFVDQVNLAASESSRSVSIVAQAVGEDHGTLVFIILGGHSEPTTYLAKAFLARMTSVSRFTPAIAEMGLSEEFDIYNVAAVLGFQRIVVSDGRAFSHQADLKREAP